MIVLLKLIIITCILVMGLKIAMSDKMLLENLGRYFERKVDNGQKIFDLFICPWCMGTLQAITAHAFAFGLNLLPFEWNWQLLIRYPLIVMASGLIDGLIWTTYTTINQIRERNEEEKIFFYKLNSDNDEKE